MKKISILSCLLFSAFFSKAQFPPQAELVGSTAMYKDSSVFIDWASQCIVNRGWMNISDTTLGETSIGSFYSALGKADGDVVSLGDGGEAIYYVENAITNGQGYDFAIFENGFMSPEDSALVYLELAEVSVSNDGINYTKFNAVCNHDTLFQIPGFGEYMNASIINNLAGKYKHDYGTPFDLSELDTTGGHNFNSIHYIKIKDVIGTINPAFCSRDMNGRKINDPYPTPFPSGGFDLDALGIIHQQYPTSINSLVENKTLTIYPNPATNKVSIQTNQIIQFITVYSLTGVQQQIEFDTASSSLNIEFFKPGIYFLSIQFENGYSSHQYLSKHE